nr:PREDICTED: fatty acid synthase-like [Bemisia tabaci]
MSEKFEVVISGIGGHFPECNNVDELTEFLFNKKNGITVDSRRWTPGELNAPAAIGKLKYIDRFDSLFFGIHRKLCESLDSLTRHSLERAIEAIIDAGICPSDLHGSNTAVLMASTVSESEFFSIFDSKDTGFGILGHNRAMQANRVSYSLNLYGPSYTMDSTWTGGTQGLSLAKTLIENGHVNAAIVGIANLILHPTISLQFQSMGKLTTGERTKSFCADADGYNRAEGCVVLFLQRACEARRSYGTVISVNNQCFGDRDSMYVEDSGPHLKELLTQSYKKSGIDPKTVGFVEAEGSACKRIDAMELNAMADVFCPDDRKDPLLVGSIKSNIGHTEAASSLVSLTKAIIALDTGFIPPNINYDNPNNDVPAISNYKIKVVSEKTPLTSDLVGVTSFGLCCNYSHSILRRNPKAKKPKLLPHEMFPDELPRLLLLCGRHEEGVREMLKVVESHGSDEEYAALIHHAFRKNILNYNYRTFTMMPNLKEEKEKEHEIAQLPGGNKRPLWFVFSGMGSQWHGMGTQLMKIPLFAQTIEKLQRILEPRGVDLKHILTSTDRKLFDNILNSFVGIAAIQIGLVDILNALQIFPDGIVGHSVGELGCAYADGCFTAEEMILSAYARGRASIETELIHGKMAAIGMGYQEIKDELPPSIEVACHNAADSCTLSGPSDDVEEYVAVLKERGVFARAVNVSDIAYHSRYISPAAPKLLKYLKEVILEPKPRSKRWISSSIPETEWGSPLAATSSPEYHTNNLLSAVLFEEASKHIPKNAIVIEIAPHGLLQAILRRSLDSECTNIPLTQRNNKKALYFLMTAIGKMYLAGLEPQIENLYPPVQFPVSRGTPSLSTLVTWDHHEQWSLGNMMTVIGIIPGERFININLNDDQLFLCFKLRDRYVLPSAALLFYVWETQKLINSNQLDHPIMFENLQFFKNVEIPNKSVLHLFLLYQRGSGDFEYYWNDELICKGKLSLWEGKTDSLSVETDILTASEVQPNISISSDEIYQLLEGSGYHIDKKWQTIIRQSFYDDEWHGVVTWKDNWIVFLDSLLKLSILKEIESGGKMVKLTEIQQLIINPTVFNKPLKDFNTVYHLISNTLKCEGIFINGAKATSLDIAPYPSILKLESQQFMPADNLNLKDEKDFVAFCVQMMVDCCNQSKEFNEKLKITVLEVQNGIQIRVLIPFIESILQKQSNLETYFKRMAVDDMNEDFYSGKDSDSCHFLVTGHYHFFDALSVLEHKRNGFLLVRIPTDEPMFLFVAPKLQKIAENSTGKERLILYRYVNSVLNPRLHYSVVNAWSHPDWINETQGKLNEAAEEKALVFMVVYRQPDYGIQLFIKEMAKLQFSHLLRYVFILDKTAPHFSFSNIFYRKELLKDLPVNIYFNGKWSFLKKSTIKDAIQHFYPDEEPRIHFSASMFEGVAVHYLGVNVKNLSLDRSWKNLELGALECSGYTPEGKAVMGLVKLPVVPRKLVPDQRLSWHVPSTWTMEDAVTVPLDYSLAYFALLSVADLLPEHKVLIHAGLSTIGQAMLSVVHSEGAVAFTTVPHAAAHAALSKLCPFIPKENILDTSDPHWELKLRFMTKGSGVNIVVNCLSGTKTFASVRCLAVHGKFLQMSSTDSYNKEQLGMGCFLAALQFYSISPNRLFDIKESDKDKIHSLVQKGIDTGVVRPLKRKVIPGPCSGEKAIEALMSSSQEYGTHKVVLALQSEKSETKQLRCKHLKEKFYFDPDKMHLILGGKSGSWLELADWLVSRGVRKLTIAADKHGMSSSVARKFNLLLVQYPGTVIQMASTLKISSVPETIQFLKDITSIAPLSTVFFLKLNNASNKVRNLHEALEALSMETLFVSLLSGGVEECYIRKQYKQPCLCILPESKMPVKTSRVLAVLDELLLKTCMKSNEPAIVTLSEHQLSGDLDVDIASLHVSWHLPSSLNDLVQFRSCLAEEPKFEEVPTRSLKFKDAKGTLPFFIIPGLNSSCLEKLYRRLAHPTFVAKLPLVMDSIENTAEQLVRSMKQIQDSISYTIIGDSWGGALTLQIVHLLELEGKRVMTYLLEGAPETGQNWARSLFTDGASPRKLMSRYWTMSEETKKLLAAESNLDAQLDYLLQNETKQRQQCLKESFSGLLHLILCLLKYKPPAEKINNKIMLFKCKGALESDSCGLAEISGSPVSIHISNESDYESMVSCESTVIIIHEEAGFEYPDSANRDVSIGINKVMDTIDRHFS